MHRLQCLHEPPKIMPFEPVVTFTLKSKSISLAPRITTSSLPAIWAGLFGFAYKSAEILWCVLFFSTESTAARSKHCTSYRCSKSPSSKHLHKIAGNAAAAETAADIVFFHRPMHFIGNRKGNAACPRLHTKAILKQPRMLDEGSAIPRNF